MSMENKVERGTGSGVHSVRQISERLWALEQELGLLDWRLAGVYPWQCQRMAIYYEIAKRTGVLEEPQRERPRATVGRKLGRVVRAIREALMCGPFFARAPVETLVFEHPRAKPLDGRRVDIYTSFLVDELRRRGERCFVLASGLEVEEKSRDPARRSVALLYVLASVAARILRPRLTQSDRERLARLEREVERSFGVEFDIADYLVTKASLAAARYRLFKWLFKRLRTRNLYCVVSYALGPQIQAAKEAGVVVTELQHGTFSRFHLGYSFPGRERELACFPDRMHVWSGFWRDRIALPIDRARILVRGFRYQDEALARYVGVRRHPNRLLVISQGAIGSRLAAVVWAHRDQLTGFDIKYKLHPGEVRRWRRYPELRSLAELDNVEVVEEGDLYALMASSRFQLGVFSTALFEGMAMGLETVLVDLPGFEYMEDLVQLGQAVMLEEFLAAD